MSLPTGRCRRPRAAYRFRRFRKAAGSGVQVGGPAPDVTTARVRRVPTAASVTVPSTFPDSVPRSRTRTSAPARLDTRMRAANLAQLADAVDVHVVVLQLAPDASRRSRREAREAAAARRGSGREPSVRHARTCRARNRSRLRADGRQRWLPPAVEVQQPAWEAPSRSLRRRAGTLPCAGSARTCNDDLRRGSGITGALSSVSEWPLTTAASEATGAASKSMQSESRMSAPALMGSFRSIVTRLRSSSIRSNSALPPTPPATATHQSETRAS